MVTHFNSRFLTCLIDVSIVGVNAVDMYGTSSLMAAVEAGSKMQMVVASLINSWRPTVDVGYSKPSGHSVLFYTVTQVMAHSITLNHTHHLIAFKLTAGRQGGQHHSEGSLEVGRRS